MRDRRWGPAFRMVAPHTRAAAVWCTPKSAEPRSHAHLVSGWCPAEESPHTHPAAGSGWLGFLPARFPTAAATSQGSGTGPDLSFALSAPRQWQCSLLPFSAADNSSAGMVSPPPEEATALQTHWGAGTVYRWHTEGCRQQVLQPRTPHRSCTALPGWSACRWVRPQRSVC